MRLLVKTGGALVDEAALRESIAREIAVAAQAGHEVCVVHGGGKQLSRFLEERGVVSRFIDGFRVTSAEAMDGVVKVLAGTVNKQLTASLRAEGVNAVGISGVDGRLASAEQLSVELGLVGRIHTTNGTLLHLLSGAGMVPVIACVAGDDQGRIWNINADQMAVACARAFGAHCIVFLTDVPGVLGIQGEVISELDTQGARDLIRSGVAGGGMRAKLEAAIHALESGIGPAVIAGGACGDSLERVISGGDCGTKISR